MHKLLAIETAPSSASFTETPLESPAYPFEAPARPAKVVSRKYAAVPLKEASANVYEQRSSAQVFDASDLERSRPVTPTGIEELDDAGAGDNGNGMAIEALQTIWEPRMNRYRLATAALINFANGLNDSAAGAVLEYIERHFNIGYAIVSLIFVGVAFGSITAAPLADPLRLRLGRSRTFVLSQLVQALGCIPIISMKAPFAAVVVGFYAMGFGEALNLAMINTFCANLSQSTLAMGLVHGAYGVGGIAGPLIATALAVRSGAATDANNKTAAAYSRYYIVPFSIMVLTAGIAYWTFDGYDQEIAGHGHTGDVSDNMPSPPVRLRRHRWHRRHTEISLGNLRRSQPSTAAPSRANSRTPSPTPKQVQLQLTRTSSRPAPTPLQSASENPTPAVSYSSMAPIMGNNGTTTPPLTVTTPATKPKGICGVFSRIRARMSRVVLLGALFLMCYQGSEVAIAGWVTSYLIAVRGGEAARVGYVASGFWGGITVGRFVLAGPAHHVGERRAVYACVIGAGVFELLVWFVPNIIGDAVAVSIVGLLLGPVYPCAASEMMRAMSRHERVTGIGIIAAFGSVGGAIFPFVTGVLAQVAGTFVLHPIALGLFAFMVIFWFHVPAPRKPVD